MLRRLFTVLLAIACACAPVLAATAPKHEADTCCCAGQCPCAPTESTAPTGSTCTAPTAPAVVEERAKPRKPAPRTVRPPQHRLLLSAAPSASALRTPFAFSDSPVAGVALFRAHCVFLI